MMMNETANADCTVRPLTGSKHRSLGSTPELPGRYKNTDVKFSRKSVKMVWDAA